MSTITVSLLGPFEVTLDGRTVDVPRGHQRTLVASLALNASQPVSQQTLVRLLWGAEPPRDPRNAIQVQVRRVRGLLGDDRISSRDTGYLLDIEPDEVDALRFDRLAAAAASASPARSSELLADALGLWRGDPLTGVGSDALDREYGSALAERRLLAVERRADANLAQSLPDRDLAELWDVAVQNPLREPLWARLIASLIESGNASDALACYEQIREHLVERVGAEPGPDLQRLHRRIEQADRGDPLWWLPATDSGGAPRAIPHQLPQDPVGFVGRRRELATMNELLAGRGTAPPVAQTLCAIHGPAGVGKTALAVHWAQRVADEFPDGQLYVDLQGCGPAPLEPASALAAMLQAVGVPLDQLPAELAALTAMFRRRLAGRRMLLLLDNVRDADQVRPLLPGARSLVVVTSRSGLEGLRERDGARPVPVGELDDEDARKLLARHVAPARVAREPVAVHRLVELCGGLPLALRIVADRAAGEPATDLAAVADDLASARGRRARPDDSSEVAADLRGVFAWSYARLEPETARIFRLLGLYPGTAIGPHGVAALAGRSTREARRELDRLVSVHLLAPGSPGRYRLHDLLGEYAAELIVDDDGQVTADALRRIVDWCLLSVLRARETLGEPTGVGHEPDRSIDPLTFPTSDEALRWIDTDRELLVAAVRTATGHGLYRAGHQLAHVLRTAFHDRLRYEEFVLVAELGVECARHLGDDDALAGGLRTLGVAYTWADRTDEAAKPLREAVEHAERLGDLARLASAADGLAVNCARAGDFATALTYHRKAVDASRRLGDPQAIGDSLMNLGFSQIDSGDCEAGVATTKEALAIFDETGAELSGAFALGNLADAYQRSDRAALAVDHAQRALAVLRRLGGPDATAEVLVTLGRAHQASGERPEAEAAWWEAADLVGAEHWLSPTIADLLGKARSTQLL